MYTGLETIGKKPIAWKTLDFPFLFSFVVAVYNVEDYIDEAMESLICQDIGFENIQIILVDDGSTDTSGEICDRYAQEYPENIIALHKENGGASSARNVGYSRVQGKYVGSMDPDDKISLDACSKVFIFFEDHYDETNIVTIPRYWFDAKNGEHALNYKFKGNSRVVNLLESFDICESSTASSFVKNEVIRCLKMDEKLETAEDLKLILDIFYDKPSLGLVHNAKYYYRKRRNTSQSLTTRLIDKKSWYFSRLEGFIEQSFLKYKKGWGYIPKFVQYAAMYELQWHFREPRIPFGVLSAEEKTVYWEKMLSLLEQVDDCVIRGQRYLSENMINLVLSYKSRKEYEFAPNLSARLLTECYRKRGIQQQIDFIDVGLLTITIEGRIVLPVVETRPIVMVAELDGKQIPCDTFLLGSANMVADHPLSNTYGFCFRFSVRPDIWQHKVTFFLHPGDDWVRICKFSYSSHCVFGKEYSNSYSWPQKRRRITENNGTLLFSRSQERVRFRMEICLLRQLWKQNKQGERKAVLARLGRTIWKKTHKKPLWIIMDRPDRAGDSGEALFRYINKKYSGEVRACFALREDSPDFARMQQIGETLDPRSKKYKFLFLCSDVIVSSEALDEVTNPFGRFWAPYRDIISQRPFILLQHGVILDDLSRRLDRYHTAASGWVASSVAERDSIRNSPYHITLDKLWLTGLPRFDGLYHDERRQILVAPSWRQYLMGKRDSETGQWEKGMFFDSSEYVRFYRELLRDEGLRKAAKQYGYTLAVLPHPNVEPYLEALEIGEDIRVYRNGVREEALAQSDLLVTDYSSVGADFAYLEKPVVYCQFDRETYCEEWQDHQPGYFDYEQDGFGEVTLDKDSLVRLLEEYMASDCLMKETYRKRVERFFFYRDQENCARVYQKIKEEAGM